MMGAQTPVPLDTPSRLSGHWGWAHPVLTRLGACPLTGRDIPPSNFLHFRVQTLKTEVPRVGQAGN